MNIRIAVVRITNGAAFAEQRIRFIEEQNCVRRFRFLKNLRKILFGLAYILADDRRQIDLIQLQSEFACNHAGRERFTGARGAGEQRIEARRTDLRMLRPILINPRFEFHVITEFAELSLLLFGQDKIIP